MKLNNLSKKMAAAGLAAVLAVSGTVVSGVSEVRAEGDTITVGMKASHVEISNIETFKAAWEEKTGNKVDVQAIDDNQFDSLLQTKMSTSGMWDIFIGDTGTQSTSYQHEKNLVDLSGEEWVDKLTDTGKEFVTHTDGKIYCFPNGGVNSFGIVYNKDVFEENGLKIPKTFDEFNAVCDTLKEAGITPVYVSMADAWTVNQIMNGEWPNILSANPDSLDKLNANEERWDDIPEFNEMFVRLKGYVDSGYINSDMSTAKYEMGQKAVATGEAAMMYMGDWADPEFAKVAPDDAGTIGIFAAPTKDGNSKLAIAGPGGYYISNQSKNVDAAKDFLNFMAEEDNIKLNLETRACTSVWKDIEAVNLSETLKDTQAYIDEGNTEIHYNQTYVITPSDEANSAFLSVLLGQREPEECAKIWSDAVITTGKQLGFDGFK
ncbi:MAG: ABC transporter substrate-binding protein [Eubacteriales bacterium]|nr:ABC transporter substrate-binding protein [Eubacteriales bacterium]